MYHYLMYPPFNQTWSEIGFDLDGFGIKKTYITKATTSNFPAKFWNLPIVICHTYSFSFLHLKSLSRYGNNATKLQ